MSCDPRAAALERFRRAKISYDRACWAVFDRVPESEAQVTAALAEFEAARSELKRLDEAGA